MTGWFTITHLHFRSAPEHQRWEVSWVGPHGPTNRVFKTREEAFHYTGQDCPCCGAKAPTKDER